MNIINYTEKKRAVTLVEMFIVLIIIAFLAGALVLTFEKVERKSKLTVDIASVRNAKTAAVLKYAEDISQRSAVYAYDGEKAIRIDALTEGEPIPEIKGYGKSKYGVWKEEYGAAGNPVSENGTSNYHIIFVDKGKTAITWSEEETPPDPGPDPTPDPGPDPTPNPGPDPGQDATLREIFIKNKRNFKDPDPIKKGDILLYNGKYYVAAKDDIIIYPSLTSDCIRVNIDSGFVTENEMTALKRGDVYKDPATGDMYCWIKGTPYGGVISPTTSVYNGNLPPTTEEELSQWVKVTVK